MGKKGKEAKRKEKKQRTGKKHLSLKPNEYYEVSGESVTRKRKNCPRCGPGTWLGEHKGRLYCGKCGYTEFERKQSDQQVPGKPEVAKPPEHKPGSSEPGQEKPKESQETPEKQ